MTDPRVYNTWFPVHNTWYKRYYQDELLPEFVQWCAEHGVRLQQMHIDYGFCIPNEEVHVLFKLRWGWISANEELESYRETHRSLYDDEYYVR